MEIHLGEVAEEEVLNPEKWCQGEAEKPKEGTEMYLKSVRNPHMQSCSFGCVQYQLDDLNSVFEKKARCILIQCHSLTSYKYICTHSYS